MTDITQLNSYMEVLHGDFQLPGGEDSGLRWHTNPNRRIHVYERCSQFSILQNLPNAYMWASPMPKRALEQYHLVLRKCPAHEGCSGLSGQGDPAPGRADLCAAAAQAGGADREMTAETG